MKKINMFFTAIMLVAAAGICSNSVIDTGRVFGVTIDGIENMSSIITSLSSHNIKPVTRIVFDEFVPVSYYDTSVSRIHKVSFIMGELSDSYSFNQYSLQAYIDRVNEYYNALANRIDIWEIGNEINGEWLGNTPDVVAKMTSAYNIIKSHNAKTELTLYYNWNCWSNPANEMFRWVNTNVPANMKAGLDYVLVSYYEDDCNNFQPNWQKMMDSLHVIFPNSKIGIGECGTSTASKKAGYIQRYYTMNITTPNFVRGCFWWYYKQDCVPKTNALWTTLENAIKNTTTVINPDDNTEIPLTLSLKNYPNPFNPVTKIYYTVPKASNVKLAITDISGRDVAVLVNQYKYDGEYIVDFNGEGFSSGVYFYRLETGGQVITNKMVLLK